MNFMKLKRIHVIFGGMGIVILCAVLVAIFSLSKKELVVRIGETEDPSYSYQSECRKAAMKNFPIQFGLFRCSWSIENKKYFPMGSKADCVISCW